LHLLNDYGQHKNILNFHFLLNIFRYGRSKLHSKSFVFSKFHYIAQGLIHIALLVEHFAQLAYIYCYNVVYAFASLIIYHYVFCWIENSKVCNKDALS